MQSLDWTRSLTVVRYLTRRRRRHALSILAKSQVSSTICSPARQSQAQNRKKILKDRNNTSSHSFQTTALFQTSAPVSISRDPDCVPYWNDQVADWSKKLLLPTETGCVSSPLALSSLSSSLMAQRSWFSQKIPQQTNGNYLRISSPLIQSSFADYKESVLPGKYFIFFI